MSYEELEDKELYDRIEKGNLAKGFINSENGKLINELAKRIVENAVTEFALKADPSDLAKIIELKIIIRKYKFGLFEEIKRLAEDGEKAEEELAELKEQYGEPTSEQGDE